jgi:peptide/nickel transport system substrate-binding protein/microcin C transport system substrate-binding protein
LSGALTTALILLPGLGTAPQVWATHAVAQFGEPKYPTDFTHFDYVNPNAPKGGTLRLSNTGVNSSFDKLNPFSLRGRPAPGLLELTFETLTVYSLDEANTQYGLLAEDIEVAPDFTAATFRLRPEARFSNGDPVTSAEVKYSFDTLASREASPLFAAYFSEIERAEILDGRTVRFVFKRPGRDLSFVAGSLPVFSPKWGVDEDGEAIPFDQLRMQQPIASGPYLVERVVESRGLTYRRNPDYWGDHVPVRRGTMNFERVVYKLYKDVDTQVSGMRAADYDFFSEVKMRYWCCQYIGKRFDSGELVKESIPHSNPPAMAGWAFNVRKERFQDPRVREALNLAFDFEWVNGKIFDNGFGRVASYFTNTPLEATGHPSPGELEILEPFRDQLDPKVFGPINELPYNAKPADIRPKLERALELFAEAGWHYRDGALRNAVGEPFVVEVTGARGSNMLMDPFYYNLRKLGIDVRQKVADAATNRSRQNAFDYDFVAFNLRESRNPGAELWRAFNSADADRPGSENVIGVKSPVIDALLTRVLDAGSQQELEASARALDRVLRHGHYVQPWRYLTHHHLIYHSRLQRPQQLPLYYGANEWVISTWWDSTADSGDAVATATH